MYCKALYVRELQRSNGTLGHGCVVDRLGKNMWDGQSAGHYYMNDLVAYWAKHGYM